MRPFWTPEMTGREMRYLEEALSFPNEGPLTERFERALAERIGVRHVICTTSGTAAILLALRCLFGADVPVVIPSLTFIATAHAATLAGLRPILSDVDERGLLHHSGEVDHPEIPVHISGRHASVGEMAVEDACEAFPKRPEGYAACYSFSPNKVITTGQGGAVATDDDLLAKRMRRYKDHGRTERGSDDHRSLGFNLRFTDLQAAVGLAQLEKLDERLVRMRAIHALYAEHLPVVPFRRDEQPLWTDIIVDDPDAVAGRVAVAGFVCRRYWKPLHRQPAYAPVWSLLPADERPFLGAERFYEHALWLPSHWSLSDEDVFAIICAVQICP